MPLSRFLVAALVATGTTSVWAQSMAQDLNQLDLEDLMKVQVVTASRRDEELRRVAAAITVISRDEIERSSARTIPELLMRVPGFDVSAISASQSAVSARGFRSRFANKLLVLLDGRSVYTPVFAGVFWEGLDVSLSEIERIEVIRGPGGSIWGSNAVNGIVNIITRRALGTHEGSVQLASGNFVRSGLQASRDIDGPMPIRVSLGYRDVADSSSSLAGEPSAFDGFRQGHVALRADREVGDAQWTVLARLTMASRRQVDLVPGLTAPYETLTRQESDSEDMSFGIRYSKRSARVHSQLSADFEHVDWEDIKLDTWSQTLGLSGQQTHVLGRADLSLGFDLRSMNVRTEGTDHTTLNDPDHQLQYSSAHATVGYRPSQTWTVAFGIKAERNSFTGWEAQPNFRVSHQLNARTSLWGAVTRAVRTPNLVERFGVIRLASPPDPGSGFPVDARVIGNPDFRSEVLDATEFGARHQIDDRRNLDLAVFRNGLRGIRGYVALPPQIQLGPPLIEQPLQFANRFDGYSMGAELAYRERLVAGGVLGITYAFYTGRLFDRLPAGGPIALYGEDGRGQFPRHTASVTYARDLGARWRVATSVRYRSEDLAQQLGPSWWGSLRVDHRLGADHGVSLSVNNLFNHRDPLQVVDIGDVVSRPGRRVSLWWEHRF